MKTIDHETPDVRDVAEMPTPRRRSPRALEPEERTGVVETLTSERFVDEAPRQVWARPLEEGVYLCSVSTMYRVLRAESGTRERHDQLRHPVYAKPELLATRPNEVWSWDTTNLRDPRHLKPLRGRVGGCRARERAPGRAAHRGDGGQAGDRAGAADAARGPRRVDEIGVGGAVAGGSGG